LNNIILAITLVVAFFMCINSFIYGYRVGKDVGKGITPKIELNPIKPIIEAIETHKQSKEEIKIKNDLDDVMGATRESMLNSIKAR
jgi:hypothetical protein